MEIKNHVSIHNRFDIEVRDVNTGELKQKAVSHNIILNQMYTRLCGGSTYFVNIHFGSGTGTLAPTRTSLFSHLGTKVAVDDTLIKSIPLSSWKRRIVLDPEEFVGSTLSEVGVAYGSTNTNLVTHSVIKDEEGNPLSIVKTDTDVITIYATVFVTFDDSNPNLEYVGMPSSNTLVNYLIGGGSAPTGVFSLNDVLGSVLNLGSTSTVTWSSDTVNKQRKTNARRFLTTVGNGHVKYLEFTNIFSLELPYASVFSGQNYDGVSVGLGDGVKTEFLLPSANVRQSSISVKKNGVVDTNNVISVVNGIFDNGKYVFNTTNIVFAMSLNEEYLLVTVQSSRSCSVYKKINGVYSFYQTISSGSSSGSYSHSPALSGDGKTVGFYAGYSFNIFVMDEFGVYNIVNSISDNANNGIFNYDGTEFLTHNGRHYKFVGGLFILQSSFESVSNRANVDATPNFETVVIGLSASPYARVFKKVSGVYTEQTLNSVLSFVPTLVRVSNNGGYVCFLGTTSPYMFMYKFNGASYGSVSVESPMSISDDNLVFITDDGLFCYASQGTNLIYFYKIMNGVFVLIGTSKNSTSTGERYQKVNDFGRVGAGRTYAYGCINSFLPFSLVKFNTPPALNDVITADYTVDGVHKTENYVIDVSFDIQFGEVV